MFMFQCLGQVGELFFLEIYMDCFEEGVVFLYIEGNFEVMGSQIGIGYIIWIVKGIDYFVLVYWLYDEQSGEDSYVLIVEMIGQGKYQIEYGVYCQYFIGKESCIELFDDKEQCYLLDELEMKVFVVVLLIVVLYIEIKVEQQGKYGVCFVVEDKKEFVLDSFVGEFYLFVGNSVWKGIEVEMFDIVQDDDVYYSQFF